MLLAWHIEPALRAVDRFDSSVDVFARVGLDGWGLLTGIGTHGTFGKRVLLGTRIGGMLLHGAYTFANHGAAFGGAIGMATSHCLVATTYTGLRIDYLESALTAA